MVVRAEVKGELLTWARERSGLEAEELELRFPKLAAWELGEVVPTLRQLENFAQATHTPVGFLFLATPPDEPIPIPDFRTLGDRPPHRPSPDLLDAIFLCQQRQEWFHDFAQATGEDPVQFVGSVAALADVEATATNIRNALAFHVPHRGHNWSEALRLLSDAAEAQGVLVMISGIVGSNTHRRLDPNEFRGFALSDLLAPVIFVNGADTKAAQIFTLAHELVHIASGETALSDADLASRATNEVERWCNHVAAEVLVPLAEVQRAFDRDLPLTDELERLARVFKVSTLVILRRLQDADFLDWDEYRAAYRAELDKVLALLDTGAGAGGNFYNTQPVRVSKRFARAIIGSTLEGQTLQRDALRMLGFRRESTFNELAVRLGVT